MIIAIIGKTNCGKDSVVKYIKKEYGIPMVVSHTTRPIRCYETHGIEHYFDDDAEMDRILAEGNIIAYTKNEQTGIRYCATAQSIGDSDVTYIINPNGIRWFKEYGAKDIEMKDIYIQCDEYDILRRGLARGDDPEVLQTRLNSERDEFDEFFSNSEWDYVVYNVTTLDDLYAQVDTVMKALGFNKIQ